MNVRKSFVILFILQTLFTACSENNSQNNQTGLNEGEIKSIEMSIEGMSCMSCVANVKKTLTSIDGVMKVNVSLQDKHAMIKYAPEKVTWEQLKKAINKIGYKAGNIKELKE